MDVQVEWEYAIDYISRVSWAVEWKANEMVK